MHTPDSLLKQLDDQQQEVATALFGPVCVWAGAGSGKTRAITYRLAYAVASGQYNPKAIMPITFTQKAAGELNERLAVLGLENTFARTFHGAALKQLIHYWPQTIGGPAPTLRQNKIEMLAEVAKAAHLNLDLISIRDLLGEIEWANVSILSPDNYPAAAAVHGRILPTLEAEVIAHLMQRFQDYKTENHLMDFDDVLLLTNALLLEFPAIGKEIRQYYKHFVVDEYQDVSPVQQQLLTHWIGDSQEICVVGDPAQTIYTFAGASNEYLLNFPKQYPKCTLIKLNANYRSTKTIVKIANNLASKHSYQAADMLQLKSLQKKGLPITYTVYDDDYAQAEAVAEQIHFLHISEKYPYHEMAILYRTNLQANLFSNALAKLGIHSFTPETGNFYSRPEVKKFLFLLKMRGKIYDNDNLLEIVTEDLNQCGWLQNASAHYLTDHSKQLNLEVFYKLAMKLHQDGTTVSQFYNAATKLSNTEVTRLNTGVMLSSLHNSKGLEWEVVFITGISEGILPISLAKTTQALAEEERLLYVGVTRAKKRLFLSYALQEQPQDKKSPRELSRFLTAYWPK